MATMNARPPGKLICDGCGCTDDHACPGGCHWVSFKPPVCSACTATAGDLADAADPRGSFFSDELCPGSQTPALHAPLYVDANSGYCARCYQGFLE